MGAHQTADELRDRYEAMVAPPRAPTTVGGLIDAWLEHCRSVYPNRNGQSSTATNARNACRELRLLYADLPLTGVGGLRLKHLEAARLMQIEAGLARRTINDRQARIRQMLRWSLERGWLVGGVPELKGLRRERTERGLTVVESDPKRTPSLEEIVRVLRDPRLPRVVGDMMRVQLRTGMRSGELVTMRGVDLDISASPWIYTPAHHKTSYLGRRRLIQIGPRSQLVLLPYLKDGLLFTVHRGPRRGKGWAVSAYYRAIRRAAERVGPPEVAAAMSPQAFRRRALTEAARQAGIETAQRIAGHGSVRTTEGYVGPEAVLGGVVGGFVDAWG